MYKVNMCKRVTTLPKLNIRSNARDKVVERNIYRAGADPGLTVGGCLGIEINTARVSARNFCATPTFAVISAHMKEAVRIYKDR